MADHHLGLLDAVVRAGRNPRARVHDLMLAAVAVDLDAVLVTRNPRDFTGTADLVQVVAVAG